VQTEMNNKNLDLVAGLWDKTGKRSMVCPKCHSKMIIVQLDPVQDAENAYVPYDTVIECTKCDFNIRAESFTILGAVKNFDLKNLEIGSWSPSGSRVISNYEHVLNYDLLKELKESGELKEFLIVNKQVVQVIG
jgi:hypothetical protein